VRRLFATSILARLPLTMLSIGLLVHAQHLTGSFAAAGLVTGVYAIALGVGGPLLGQLVDRRGQTRVLLASATAAAVLLVAIALQPVGVSLAVLLAAGVLVSRAGPTAGFALAGGAGALAMLTALLRSRTLAARQAPVITLIHTGTDTDEPLAHQAAA
jgi:MFS family permease